ncbi:hypothetical protein [Paenibacillus sp. GCM10028914]|uniref:hypothetical protein n=1 Tax=Paenibacillus sp. GCM10028914 TaxID=3273416 RepID=UPI00361D735B
MLDNQRSKRKGKDEATVAPGMDRLDMLQTEATEDEIKRGDFTEVTQLIIDRTPED